MGKIVVEKNNKITIFTIESLLFRTLVVTKRSLQTRSRKRWLLISFYALEF